MTTTITVKANHGSPVRVTPWHPTTGEQLGEPVTVAAGLEQDFYVHSDLDQLVHEIQPSETDAAA